MAIPGSVVASGNLLTPGGDQGLTGVPGPTGVSANAGNAATLGSDNLIYVSDSGIASVISQRTRGYSSIGNGNFEVDQRSVGAWVVNPASGAFVIDRWLCSKTLSTASFQATADNTQGLVLVPGTNFAISQKAFRVYINTSQASLAAGDLLAFQQYVEGPQWRELSSDVHSIQLLVKSDVVPLKFSIALRDQAASRSLVKLCTISSAGWQLIQLPNLPVWASGGTYPSTPGSYAYSFAITLACGTTLTAPAADTWQSGNYLAAPGMDNWLSKPTGTNFFCAFVQHEPGPLCTSLIDKPFSQNLDECLRYFCKTYAYGVAPGTASIAGLREIIAWAATTAGAGPVSFPKVMAKIPTVTIYNDSTGAAGSIRDNGGVSHTSAAAANVGDSGFSRVSFATATTASMPLYLHYTADTGW